MAIDPGVTTGICIFENGQIVDLFSANGHSFGAELFQSPLDAVAMEDSTLISHVFTSAKTVPAKMKIARNIGEVDGLCKRIKHLCEQVGLPIYTVSPKEKGKKLNAAEFKKLTKCTTLCNQHERDAAMVGWKIRNMKAIQK